MSAFSSTQMSSAGRRWLYGLALVFMTGVALVLFVLLTLATDHRAWEAADYMSLVWLNVGVAAILGLVLLWLTLRLASRWRRKRFGSRLLVKLAAIFALVGLVPGLLIYVVSYQFVSRSIETWFDARVEAALSAGLNLGRTTLDVLATDLSAKTRSASATLAGTADITAALALEGIREQLQARDVILWSSAGHAIAAAGASRFDLVPERPSATLLRQVRSQRLVAFIDGLEELEGWDDPRRVLALPASELPRIRVYALVGPTGIDLGGDVRFLQVSAPLPALLVADALSVQLANREYQERALARDGLRNMYIGTLTLALFLSVFGAVLLAVLLGNQLVRPLLVLAAGMRDVARGDLTPKAALASGDELAGLTRTFAHMTQDLYDARQAVQHSMGQVEAARASLQTILDNLTAGVVVLDDSNRMLSSNPGATRIFRLPLAAHASVPLQDIPGLEPFGLWVQQQFERFLSEAAGTDPGRWQQSFEFDAGQHAEQGQGTTLLARGALLPNGERLLVFDDVSEIISAQRAQAWGEVARRLAHEIKNPLTPIQLSAERLAMKLAHRLDGADLTLLNKSVRTIIDQVDAMQRLVNEFRDYARLPTAKLQALDLNALVRDISTLYDAADIELHLELAPDLPKVFADAQQVRQVVHNLVQNALEAMPAGAGPVLLRTIPSERGRWVRLLVLDRGPGFSDTILKRAFEPYVTTKAKGTGLGLAVVKKIMDEHGGRVDIGPREDMPQGGAQVSLSFKVAGLQQT